VCIAQRGKFISGRVFFCGDFLGGGGGGGERRGDDGLLCGLLCIVRIFENVIYVCMYAQSSCWYWRRKAMAVCVCMTGGCPSRLGGLRVGEFVSGARVGLSFAGVCWEGGF
jgi:hypothetical protein